MKHKYLIITCLLAISVTTYSQKLTRNSENENPEKIQRVVVAEEVASIKCKWCPEGAVSFKMMKEKYPETFIGITAHVMDVLEVTDYIEGLGSKYMPMVLVNRTGDFFKPTFDKLEEQYLKEIEKEDIASMNISAGYTNQEQTSLHIQMSSIFTSTYATANFRYVVVLTENNVKGDSPDYDQVNIYSGGGQGPMGGFENLPNPVPASQMVYHDVARMIYPSFKGMEDSLPMEIEAGKEITYELTFDIPDNVINLDELEVIVLLIDGKTGEVCNAAKTHNIGEITATTHIESTSVQIYINDKTIHIESTSGNDEALQAEVYTIKGEKIAQSNGVNETIATVSSEGVYVVRVTKGNHTTVKKVIVK